MGAGQAGADSIPISAQGVEVMVVGLGLKAELRPTFVGATWLWHGLNM